MSGTSLPATQGPIALVGSGEFLPVMEPVDAALLAGRPPRVVFLPTAAAPEGKETLDYWVGLGERHYRRLGVEAVPLTVLDREDADDPARAAEIAGAGLVYLSGGNPGYLADTLRGTAVLEAILAVWQAGTAWRAAPPALVPSPHWPTTPGRAPPARASPSFPASSCSPTSTRPNAGARASWPAGSAASPKGRC